MPNSWNAFQRAHAGQGLSSSQMSSMYRSSGGGGGGGSSYTSGGGGGSSYASGGGGGSSYTSGGGGGSSSWNAFQSAHKGQGLTSADMSTMYRAAKSKSAAASPSVKTSAAATSSLSSWQQFEHDHRGQGYTPSQLSTLYHQQKHDQLASPSAAAPPKTGSKKPETWNEVQARFKGTGLSRQEVSEVYQRQKAGTTGLSSRVGNLSTASPRKPNNWNEVCRCTAATQSEHFDWILILSTTILTSCVACYMQFQSDLKGTPLTLDQKRALYHTLKSTNQESVVRPVIPEWAASGQDWSQQYQETTMARQAFARSTEHLPPPPAPEPEQIQTTTDLAIDESRLDCGAAIGRGGFGEVTAATLDGTPVAIKFLPVGSKRSVKAFTQELAALMAFSHPNVVRLFGYTKVKERPGRLGLVMEFLAGGSLWDRLHGVEAEPLEIQHKNDIAVQVGAALKFVHGKEHAHRDLKSQNILLSVPQPQTKLKVCLADFGFVTTRNQIESTMASQQSSAIFVGTPTTAAPEIYAEQVVESDVVAWQACDMYAFGVVLWEMFEEDEPHFGKRPAEIKKIVTNPDPKARLPFTAATPETLQQLIHQVWSFDPKKRPTAADFLPRLQKELG
ncbi:uncharacterized protein MONBRDRAFT_8329 [Monosiga brevicollis MX1]|uniref:Protein kinase domain-containing protein n=1 Tax=Monosiga brevicollis TaxID=81824 RepID=A9UZR4_MONBE|nr:uncharacterized protein MONBRDRAFT_8329 [Monosiga brevicollis MX1]EDQ89414.1 predicted protein [Monosiga brevicollis MX1]|eukprot:XP_001745990.1 hypothetical protein [Monosiga brevicollis MX1]